MWPPPPPPDETELEKAMRTQEESIAAAKSREIDLQIETDKLEAQRNRTPIRILLLGESGKSTILKNFQLHFAPLAFKGETLAWRAVIHLNLVCIVNFILDLLPTAPPAQPHGRSGGPSRNGVNNPDGGSTDGIKQLRMRLRPLREVEAVLSKRLAMGKSLGRRLPSMTPGPDQSSPEIVVRSGSGWKALSRLHGPGGQDQMDEMRQIIAACCSDIDSLWQAEIVQSIISGHGEFHENATTFFLNNALRICQMDYEPTVEDILRTRLTTLGVEGHRLTLEAGQIEERNREWIIYDVGGSRTQRAAWVPYFDDVSVVIFVVPLSAFNQVLDENTAMNRLFDSFQLWRTICNSKILAGITFIIIFNKWDLLAKKIEAGIQFKDFVTSYKDKPNDAQSISIYLRQKFAGIHKELSPAKRPLFSHTTCAIDSKATSIVLIRIREILLRMNLKETDLI